MDDNEGKAKIPKGTRGGKHTLILVGIWVLFTLTVLVIGLPVVGASIRKSGVLTLLSTASDTTKKTGHHMARVWFYTSGGQLRPFTQAQARMGGSAYHDTFESLLSGAKEQALKGGAVSLIEPRTTLRGITLSNKVLYIDLSRHFLESEDLKGAYEQLRLTAKGFSQVKGMVLLIGGEREPLADDW
ncbi:MAG: GerMN domain-containing protein [Sphaerochaeta sp.]|nr:GerMN domain-containing protein [Sphaerochaeta sp.]